MVHVFMFKENQSHSVFLLQLVDLSLDHTNCFKAMNMRKHLDNTETTLIMSIYVIDMYIYIYTCLYIVNRQFNIYIHNT